MSLRELGLYRKAITQSGSALKLNVIQQNPKRASQRIARLMDCEKVLKLKETGNSTNIGDSHCSFDYENSTMILECLKLVDAKKLAEVQNEAFVRNLLFVMHRFINVFLQRIFQV